MKQGGKIRLSVGRTGPCTPRTRYFSPLQAFSLRCGQGRIPLPLLFPAPPPFLPENAAVRALHGPPFARKTRKKNGIPPA